jgi:hypothetical protein
MKVSNAGRIVSVLIVLSFAAGLLVACAGVQAIKGKATLRDTIFSVEPRNNGVTVMWMTHDDVGAYCTTKPEIAAKMVDFLSNYNGEVLVDYKSLNVGDDGYNLLNGGCSTDSKNTTNYIVLDIRKTDGTR